MITQLTIGIDISKDWFDTHFALPERQAQRFTNDTEGIATFLDKVRALGITSVRLILERTGGYELALAREAFVQGCDIYFVDGVRLQNFRKFKGRARSKTDETDAALLAELSLAKKLTRWEPQIAVRDQLRELIRHRQKLVKTQTQWKNRDKGRHGHALVIAQTQEMLETVVQMIQTAEAQIRALVNADPQLKKEVALLQTIPGVAFLTAVRTLGELGDPGKYVSARSMAYSAGLVPIFKGSGKFAVKGQMKIYGNRELRTALYMPAIIAMQKNTKSPFSEFSERVLGNGTKAKMTVVVATMRKLIHVIYGVLKHQKPFDPEKFTGDMRSDP